MSDPVTNVEIEDVLSSIRRLVSSEDRQERPASGVSIKDADKLVLTPSLRVDNAGQELRHDDGPAAVLQTAVDAEIYENQTETDVEHDGSSLADEAENEKFGAIDALKDDPAAIEKADADAGVAHTSEDADGRDQDLAQDPENHTLPNIAESAADQTSDSRDETTEEVVEQSVEGSERSVAEPWFKSDRANKDRARQEPGHSVLGARVAEFEKFVAARDDDWEPDGISDDAYAGSSVSPLPWHDQVSDQDDEARSSTDAYVHDEKADAEIPTEIADDAVDGATDDLEGVEAVQTSNDPGNEDNFEQGVALVLDDPILDEDALRDMVSEIVRQELQGALGERITRNVRKLVRREIHRALSSQELE